MLDINTNLCACVCAVVHITSNHIALRGICIAPSGSHALWLHIPEKFKQALRAFLVHFFTQVLQWESVHERPTLHRHCLQRRHPSPPPADANRHEVVGSEEGGPEFYDSDEEILGQQEAGDAFHFDFTNGSIGNFVLTGARLFYNSLEVGVNANASKYSCKCKWHCQCQCQIQ